MEIKYIDIIFENVTFTRISADDLLGMKFEGLSDYYPCYANGMSGLNCGCDYAEVHIKSSAKDLADNLISVYGNISPAERIKQHPDITSIIVYMENKDVKEYFPPYEGEEINSLQCTFFDDNRVIVKIGKKHG